MGEAGKLLEDVPFPRQAWTQNRVRCVVKGIPGEERVGVLAPEILAELSRTDGGMSPRQALAVSTGDYEVLRGMHAPSSDLTTRPIRQWELAVPRGGHEIPVTACCLEAVAEDREKPAVVYFHGGGWRTGSREAVQNPLRLLAQLSGAVVFNVAYRLAPEHMYPVATDDCWQVLKYVHAHAAELGVDPEKITAAGDSAGGNLAAACARRSRNTRLGIVRRQVLIYPVLTHTNLEGVPDYHFSLDDYTYDDAQAKWIVPCINAIRRSVPGKPLYVEHPSEAASPDASPLMEQDYAAMPRTLIFCAEFDYLTRQCKTYANRLAGAGCDVSLITYRGTNHAFMNRLGQYPQAADLQKEFADFVRSL